MEEETFHDSNTKGHKKKGGIFITNFPPMESLLITF